MIYLLLWPSKARPVREFAWIFFLPTPAARLVTLFFKLRVLCRQRSFALFNNSKTSTSTTKWKVSTVMLVPCTKMRAYCSHEREREYLEKLCSINAHKYIWLNYAENRFQLQSYASQFVLLFNEKQYNTPSDDKVFTYFQYNSTEVNMH